MLDKGLKKIIFSALFGILFYLSFSKFNLWFLSFPAFFLLYNFRSFTSWFLAGVFSFFPSLLWIRIAMVDYGEVNPLTAYSLIALLVLFLVLIQFSVVFLLWKFFRFNMLVLPFLWVGMEMLRSHIPYGGFPWLLTGELIVDAPLLNNYLSAGGVYLGSLLVLMLSMLPFGAVDRKFVTAAVVSLLLPIPFINSEFKAPKDIKIAIIQPYVEESIKLDREKFYNYLPVYWKLLKRAAEEKPDIVFLPESAFPFTANRLHSEGKKLMSFSKEFLIVTGLIDIRFGDSWEPYNSVFVLGNGKVIDFYDKVKLLPFGEYVPFPFGFAKEVFGAIGGTDYVPGNEPRCLKTNGISIGTPICFEVSYYQLVKKFSRCADLIAVFTNDGWFKDSDGTFQHLRQARVRAVENRRYVLWVNNTGPSAVISPTGKILKQLPYGEEGIIFFSFQE
ncbi:apolipoprotein N-acyltransferase [Hydrogenivirga caldilitoris]|uniref:Apolipoprotein N-acyltransferase n=1 Tax=Hydrogenivirga caldilitoris TaxID=246264 RepID=A0A497XQA1_9AQUI|nr:apolipoprotein N-acyltransferase [Hydrogenivirga caldilitoris]RLJ71078.1 apolipoprotein N-acyltransferase [Hydrogenivirga caldilitoris]